jgi:hypothetical protein
MKAKLTDHEEQLVLDYIYKTYLVEVLELDLKGVSTLNFKIKEAYEGLIEATLRRLRKDLSEIKEEFKGLNAKVVGPEFANEDFIRYQYFVRGYQGEHRFFKYHFRNTASKLLEDYFTKKPYSIE